MSAPLRIGLAGLGTVGAGVAKVLRSNQAGLAARAGRSIALSAMSARDAKKDRGVDLSGAAFEKDPLALASRADVDVVVELIGGEEGVAYAKKMQAIIGTHHKMRFLDPSKFYFSGTDSMIFGDKLIIFSVRQNIFAIVIENKNIADTYRAAFNAAWEVGNEA